MNGATLLSNVGYRPFTQAPKSWQWGNGSTFQSTFDVDGRMTSVKLGTVQRAYQYDAAGRISSQTDTNYYGPQTTNLTYDESGQLTGYGGKQYAYDANGNRRSEWMTAYPGVTTITYQYSSGTNRLTYGASGGATYNSDGTLSRIGDISFGYDVFRNLTNLVVDTSDINGPRNSTITYRYDARGRRVVKNFTWTTSDYSYQYSTAFLYDDSGRLLSERQVASMPPGSGQSSRYDYVWFGGTLVGVVKDGELYGIATDNLGTPRSAIRMSDGGEVWRWDSDPFGTTAIGEGPDQLYRFNLNLRFPGQYFDVETGLHYNGARYYDPRTGRYVQPDPIGLAGGSARYTYAAANPLSFVDERGLVNTGVTQGELLLIGTIGLISHEGAALIFLWGSGGFIGLGVGVGLGTLANWASESLTGQSIGGNLYDLTAPSIDLSPSVPYIPIDLNLGVPPNPLVPPSQICRR